MHKINKSKLLVSKVRGIHDKLNLTKQKNNNYTRYPFKHQKSIIFEFIHDIILISLSSLVLNNNHIWL
ncbi:hypothetical protein MtrunA17_Chr1g0160021 [Medicago truncatula]|uniref:Uncharacterized protein n=1 Tax=Medicago truncatula TaxID=3880 RepID=A0A396JI68_MEDTR|nr:hypothetical protein MtrunA17_Chr1g0160021 [Medicago truncatula]